MPVYGSNYMAQINRPQKAKRKNDFIFINLLWKYNRSFAGGSRFFCGASRSSDNDNSQKTMINYLSRKYSHQNEEHIIQNHFSSSARRQSESHEKRASEECEVRGAKGKT